MDFDFLDGGGVCGSESEDSLLSDSFLIAMMLRKEVYSAGDNSYPRSIITTHRPLCIQGTADLQR